MADVAHQGESGVINEESLGNDRMRHQLLHPLTKLNWDTEAYHSKLV